MIPKFGCTLYKYIANVTHHENPTCFKLSILLKHSYNDFPLLPARASERGNVIGSVRIYIYVCTIFFVIERTRDLIYLKFVATDFFPKIISPSAGENSGDLCYSAVSALLMNPLPDRYNYLPL